MDSIKHFNGICKENLLLKIIIIELNPEVHEVVKQ
jgi:hypothetical protein